MTLKRRTVLGALAVGVALIAATAFARGPYRSPEPRGPYRVGLEDASGAGLPTFWHDGQRFVLGEPGERYRVRIENPTPERVEAVVTIDGRDAISGRVGDFRNQRGYIVPAYGSVTVEGFRRSLDDVATFRFADPQDSYSSRLGTPENVGVVGIAFFNERPRARVVPRPAPIARDERYSEYRESRGDDARDAPSHSPPRSAPAEKSSADGAARARAGSGARPSAPSPSNPATDSVNNLGTEYGETRSSRVAEVTFDRRSARPAAVMTLRYDDLDGLASRGIDVRPYRERPPIREPEPFPNSRFAEPPP
jgi:hypothetical protein